MKKVLFTTFVIILIITASITPARSVEIGDSITYKVNKASGSFSFTANGSTTSGSVDRYRVGNEKVVVGTELNVNITSKILSSVGYTIDDNGTVLTSAGTSGSLFTNGIFYTILVPFIAMGLLGGSIEPIETDKGINMGDWVYVAPTSVVWNDIYDDFGNATEWESFTELLSFQNSDNLTITGVSKWLDEEETISLDFSMKGKYNDTTNDIQLDINHKIKYHYSILGRNLLAISQSTDISGTNKGTTTEYKVTIEVVKKGYTGLGANGFGLFIAIFSVFAVIIYRKRR